MARGNDIGRAISYMSLAAALIPCLNASGKYLVANYPTIEILWARYAGHFICMLAVFLPRRGWRLFATTHLGTQVARSTLLTIATGVYFSALAFTDLATAAAISFTAPLMVAALSGAVLGERVSLRRWVTVALGFLGPVLILRPGTGVVHTASFLLLISALCSAVHQLLTRRLVATEAAETSNTYMAVVGFLLSSLIIPFFFVLPHTVVDALLFIGLGAFGGFGHYFIVRAYEWGPAAVVAPFNYSSLIGTVILGYASFGDFPDLWTWLGAAIIIASGLYIFLGERRPKEVR